MINDIHLIRPLVRLYHNGIIDLFSDIIHTDRVGLLMRHPDNIRVIAALCLTAGMTGVARIRPSLFTQQRCRKQIRQQLLAGSALSVQYIRMRYLIFLYRTPDIIDNILVAYHILKASHVVFPL